MSPDNTLTPESPGRSISDAEKYAYADAKRIPFALSGLISAIPLLIGLWMFASHKSLVACMLPLVIVNGVYLLLSYSVMLSGSSFSLTVHRERNSRFWSGSQSAVACEISIDVYLPVCGEDRRIVLETWEGVRNLTWPGPLNVYVLDDSPDELFRHDAAIFGFHYLRRQDCSFKKAGNLRHGFLNSSGDYILLLDADFRPSPDMLTELVPCLVEDSRVAIVQSPQYFDIDSGMGWVQAGAGYVQELFYRLIQPARNRWDAAVCVGSCAVYRRTALLEIGGFTLIDHSEDIWTGFELMQQGWKIRYLPIILAIGECPKTVASFFTQQYRWCSGSLTLVARTAFWTSSLTIAQKLCYFSGLVYYLATAANVFFAPAPPLIMVAFFPDLVRWYHLAFWILALVYSTLIMALWSRQPFGFHFLSTRELSSAAHLLAVFDSLRGRLMSWVPTGFSERRSNLRTTIALCVLLASSGSACIITWCLAVSAVVQAPTRFIDFAPPVFFLTLHAFFCWRVLSCPSAQTALLSNQGATVLGNVIRRTGRFINQPLNQPALQLVSILVSVAAMIAGTGLAAGLFGLRGQVGSQAMSNLSPLPEPGQLDAPTARIGKSFWMNADEPISQFADFGPWTVENAFPSSDPLWGVMRIRQHPQDDNVFYAASHEGAISELRHTDAGWKVRTVVTLDETVCDFLYSLALHPQFPQHRKLYVFYRTGASKGTDRYRVSSLTLSPALEPNAIREEVLIDQQISNTEHLGGDLEFDHNGFLLISVGDNSLSHQDVNSQRIDKSLFSGILRIDVDRQGSHISHEPPRQPESARTQGYDIPNDNPFVGKSHVLEEFWAIGLRNPFRISYDRSINRLWIGEVGQDRFEQIELASAGTNHLWSIQEGTLPYDGGHLRGKLPSEVLGRPVNPLYEYPHDDQNYCVIGGIVYQGNQFPELRGQYLFGDNHSGRVWALNPQHPEQAEPLLQLPFTKKGASLVSISASNSGDLLFTNYASWPPVFKLRRSHLLRPPLKLSETGLFADLKSLTPGAGFISYEVNVPLWSDGLNKRRWLRLPRGQQIDNTGPPEQPWKFPAGTVFVKHFEYPADSAKQAGRRLETRVYILKEDGQILGCSYLWLDDQSDAVLQLERSVLTLPVPGEVTNDRDTFDYLLPGSADCSACHNRLNPVLGVNLLQLNRPGSDSASSTSQLVSMSQQGLFRTPYPSSNRDHLPSLVPLDALSASVEQRARSYLHANCSFCHFQHGMQRVNFDLRLPSSGGEATEACIGHHARLHYQSIDGEHLKHLITPGSPETSALYRRMKTTDRTVSMPYLGRTLPDEQAIGVIEEWIRSLPVPANEQEVR